MSKQKFGDFGLCILCGLVHPQAMSCAEAKASQARADQNAARAARSNTKWLNRLMKWRAVFVGRILGTRLDTDPMTIAARDHLEMLLSLRVETSAIAKLMIDRGHFTAEEFMKQIEEESEYLCGLLEKKFPGFKATDIGMDMDIQLAVETTKGWPQ